MATNPMQRKSRISFLLGMLLMLIIAALVIAFLYMKIRSQQEDIEKYKKSTTKVCVLKKDVKSGEIILPEMFEKRDVSNAAIPSNATVDVGNMIENTKIIDTQGRSINIPTTGKNYYYYVFEGQDGDAILYKDGEKEPATTLVAGDKAFYMDKNNQKVYIEVAKVDFVIAKIDMKANTVITKSAIAPSDEVVTNDLRKEEYNVISLPVDLEPEEYIDVRFMLPNGQNYIVTSKKKVSIPIVNGQYVADTIQLNLTEEEILLLSCAIIENYQIDGSKLYATRYTEAGSQSAATVTYYPNRSVQTLLDNDPNMVRKAINGIIQKRQTIRDAIDKSVSDDGKSENISTKSETSITSTLEQRKNYLQGLTGN